MTPMTTDTLTLAQQLQHSTGQAREDIARVLRMRYSDPIAQRALALERLRTPQLCIFKRWPLNARTRADFIATC